MCNFPCVMCHMSHVTGHMSCVTFHIFFWREGGIRWWSQSVDGLPSTVPTPSSFCNVIIHKWVKLGWNLNGDKSYQFVKDILNPDIFSKLLDWFKSKNHINWRIKNWWLLPMLSIKPKLGWPKPKGCVSRGCFREGSLKKHSI